MNCTHQDAVRAAIRAMGDTLTVAGALLDAGREIDLSGLEREVASVCAAAVTLPAVEGRALRGELAALMLQVEEVEARIRRSGLPPPRIAQRWQKAANAQMTTNFSTWLLAAAALAGVLALLWLLARGARLAGLAPSAAGKRMAVQEITALDSRRRLVLVRVDGRDVLILTGGTQDAVVGWLP